ncbi:MAG TPA: alpha/beta hydrolase [Conexibacter sp.]|nr:alpha/beta hydrolase [Conexibacter sp.]
MTHANAGAATYVLIPGAATGPWYWDLVAAELRERGQDVVAVDLPCDDDDAGLAEYVDATLTAIGDRTRPVVVGHSLGGFTAPLVCAEMDVELLVMLQAMVPAPGEAPGEWWTSTGHAEAVREQGGDGSMTDTYFHDVPPPLAAQALERTRTQSATPMGEPWPLTEWPDVPTRFLLCREDRLFPAPFMRRVVRERLGIVPEEMDAGHLPMLARPQELAQRLEDYRAEAMGA